MKKNIKTTFSIKERILAVLDGLSAEDRRRLVGELSQMLGVIAMLKKNRANRRAAKCSSESSFKRFFGRN